MTLAWSSHPITEAKATLIWRGLVIAMAVIVHLLLAGQAHADEARMLMAPSTDLAEAGIQPAVPARVEAIMASAASAKRDRLAEVSRVAFSGHAAYAGFAGNQFLDGEMQLEFSPRPLAGFYAGYRLVDLKVDRSRVLLDSGVSGPFVGGFVRF